MTCTYLAIRYHHCFAESNVMVSHQNLRPLLFPFLQVKLMLKAKFRLVYPTYISKGHTSYSFLYLTVQINYFKNHVSEIEENIYCVVACALVVDDIYFNCSQTI